jgi:riboflavin kinase / FMN adenylyltransferase
LPSATASACTRVWSFAMPDTRPLQTATLGLPGLANGSIATVGSFDGVHRGHRDLLRRLVERAAARGLPALLVTFEPHPLEIVNPPAAPLLLTPGSERLEEIAGSDIDYVAVLPFSRQLASYSAVDFVERILLERFRMRELLIGYDHGLGRGREGDVALLRRLGDRHDFPVDVVDAVSIAGVPVSSTAARRAVSYGDLDDAAMLLGRRYSFRGRVQEGNQRGRQLGFPTLNIALPSPRKLLPPSGVYAVLLQSARGNFGGMMNLGPRPTFGDLSLSVEVHAFDATGDWYGESVRVEFVARLRDTLRFESADALAAQLGRDARDARRALTQVEERDTLRGFANNTSSFP